MINATKTSMGLIAAALLVVGMNALKATQIFPLYDEHMIPLRGDQTFEVKLFDKEKPTVFSIDTVTRTTYAGGMPNWSAEVTKGKDTVSFKEIGRGNVQGRNIASEGVGLYRIDRHYFKALKPGTAKVQFTKMYGSPITVTIRVVGEK